MPEHLLPPDVVANEFAAVAVAVDHGANGPRLRLSDLHSDRVVHLDALELETLLWLPEGVLQSWHDPSRYRWREPGEPAPADAVPDTGPAHRTNGQTS